MVPILQRFRGVCPKLSARAPLPSQDHKSRDIRNVKPTTVSIEESNALTSYLSSIAFILKMPYVIQPATTSDAPGLARAMMSAFWQDQHWKILWATDVDLETIISDCAGRLPWNIISGRSVKRHLKVVDTNSGEIVGGLSSELVFSTFRSFREVEHSVWMHET